MKKRVDIKKINIFAFSLLTIFLVNCKANFNGDINFTQNVSGTIYQATIGGTALGLAGGETVTLLNNGSESLTVTGGGTSSDQFTFIQTVDKGSTYYVVVTASPAGKTCAVGGGFGTVGDTDISTIVVNCTSGAAPTYSLGGTVSGLAGTGLILTNNASDNKVIVANGAFSFSNLLADAAPYSVTVSTQPINPKQTCTVSGGSNLNGTGVIAMANDASLIIACTTNQYTIGGTINGLAGGESVTLQNNLADDLVINGAGGGSDPFTFATALNDLSGYSVTVLSAPAGKSCTVGGGGAGTINGANVTGISITCSTTPTYTVGGTAFGVAGTVVLQNNGGDNLSISANGGFSFATPVLDGSTYSVTVFTQPTAPNQTCTISNPSGTVSGGNVTSATLICTTNTYTLGGTVTGLAGGESVTLLNNFGENAIITGAGGGSDAFTFATARNDGSYYNTTVSANPAGKTCIIGAGTGTISGANVTGIAVTCSASANYTVSATVNGLNGTVVLQNNGGDNLSISANGTFTFATALPTGATYAVTVLTQPTGPIQACTVANASGTIAAANITNVNVICTTATFTVSGTITGLAGGEQVNLYNNASELISVIGGGSGTDGFTSSPMNDGGSYNITAVNPPGKTCTVGSGTGTLAGSNVTNVTVTCNAIPTYSIGGTVTGFNAGSSSLVLQNNASEVLSISANGAFAFGTTQFDSTAYSVSVVQQPGTPNQTCTVTNGAGTVATANVTNISVNCTMNQYTVGGTAAGLKTTDTVVFQNNAGDNLSVTGGGTSLDTFTFATALNDGSGYSVTVLTNPAGKICTIGAGAGTLSGSNISNVAVSCSAVPKYSVGVTVTGYAGLGLILQNNGGDDLAIGANGSYSFPTTLLDAAAYSVTVLQQPSNLNQTCTVTSGAGTIASADVTGIAISCTTTPYTVTANVTGVTGGSITILNNGADAQIATVDGAVPFTAQNDGSTYNVTVQTPPAGKTCSVGAGTGTISGANVNVTITCSSSTLYTIGGTVSGLLGSGLVLQNNAGDDLAVAADGTYSFATSLSDLSTYSVTVKTQPATPTQTCSVTSGAGSVAGANVTNANITCNTVTYAVSGSVAGLTAGDEVVLKNNGTNGVIVASASPNFTFAPQNDGSTYSVTVHTNPPGKVCTVTGGSGTIAGANVTGVSVNCTNSFTVSVNVTGLLGSGLVLQNNAGDDLSIISNGVFTFSTGVLNGATYNVSVLTQPSGPAQTCSITNGAGTIAGVNVSNVNVACAAVTYTVGGTVTGLALSDTVTLALNAGPTTVVTGAGGGSDAFTFSANPVPDNSPYLVAVNTYSAGIICQTDATDTGTVSGANVTSVNITCTALAPEGTTAAPFDITGLTPYDGIVDSTSSYYMITGLTTAQNYTIMITSPSGDVDLEVHSSTAFNNPSRLCSSANTGSAGEACTAAPTTTTLYIMVTSFVSSASFTVNIVPPAADLGSAAAPIDITGLTPYAGSVAAVESFYTITGLSVGVPTLVQATGMTKNADLNVYSDAFTTLTCSVATTSTSERCVGIPTSSQLWFSTPSVSAGTYYTLDVIQAIDLAGSLPYNGFVSKGYTIYMVTGLTASVTYSVSITGMYDDGDLRVYDNNQYTTVLCSSITTGNQDSCNATPTTSTLYIEVDGTYTVNGTPFILDVQ